MLSKPDVSRIFSEKSAAPRDEKRCTSPCARAFKIIIPVILKRNDETTKRWRAQNNHSHLAFGARDEVEASLFNKKRFLRLQKSKRSAELTFAFAMKEEQFLRKR